MEFLEQATRHRRTEGIVRDLITDKLELADDIEFDRVHRLSGKPNSPVVARSQTQGIDHERKKQTEGKQHLYRWRFLSEGKGDKEGAPQDSQKPRKRDNDDVCMTIDW